MTLDPSAIHGIRESPPCPSMMTIGKAKLADAATLTGIAFAAKRHWGYPESWIRRWESDLTITSCYLASNPAFVATHEDQPVGFCALKIGEEEAFLDHLWVLPSDMGKGVGRALFQHAMKTAGSSGARRVKVVSDPHAEAFYLRMGAVVYGRESASMGGVERSLPLLEILL